LQNIIFRTIEMSASGQRMGLTEASACKLYAAQAAVEVTLEAVQLFGGNGYMAEFQVEQLCRDAKVLQIYAGTDEIQVSQIARSLLTAGWGSHRLPLLDQVRAYRARELPLAAPPVSHRQHDLHHLVLRRFQL